jgi:peptide/nickel transport system permease protein
MTSTIAAAPRRRRHTANSATHQSKLAWLGRKLRANPMVSAGVVLLTFFTLCAIFAPLLAPRDPAQLDLAQRLLPPSHAHWFGTDELGRDVLSRTIYGARVSLLVAITVVGSSLLVGGVLGCIAGFYEGWADTLINLYLTNAFLALPGILLAVAIVAFLGPSLINLIVALALAGWVNYARLVRGQVMAMKQREFVQAARSLGASDLRLMLHHILLSFLGLGVQPPTATWGAMLNDARSHLFESPYLVFFPAAAVALCVLAFNLVGDGLRDLLDPRTRIHEGL